MRPIGERVPLADEIADKVGTEQAWKLADKLAQERDSALCHGLWDRLLAAEDDAEAEV